MKTLVATPDPPPPTNRQSIAPVDLQAAATVVAVIDRTLHPLEYWVGVALALSIIFDAEHPAEN